MAPIDQASCLCDKSGTYNQTSWDNTPQRPVSRRSLPRTRRSTTPSSSITTARLLACTKFAGSSPCIGTRGNYLPLFRGGGDPPGCIFEFLTGSATTASKLIAPAYKQSANILTKLQRFRSTEK